MILDLLPLFLLLLLGSHSKLCLYANLPNTSLRGCRRIRGRINWRRFSIIRVLAAVVLVNIIRVDISRLLEIRFHCTLGTKINGRNVWRRSRGCFANGENIGGEDEETKDDIFLLW